MKKELNVSFEHTTNLGDCVLVNDFPVLRNKELWSDTLPIAHSYLQKYHMSNISIDMIVKDLNEIFNRLN